MSSEEEKNFFSSIPGLDSSKGERITKALQKLWMKIRHLEQTQRAEKLYSTASQTDNSNGAEWSMADLQYNLLVLQIQFVRGILRKRLIKSDPFMTCAKEIDTTDHHVELPSQNLDTGNCHKEIQTENGFASDADKHIEKYEIKSNTENQDMPSEFSKAGTNSDAPNKLPKITHGASQNKLQIESERASHDRMLTGNETVQPMQEDIAAPQMHYHLKLNDVPFILGTSATNSHSVVANVQNIIAMMKTHNKALCGGGVKRHIQRNVKSIGDANAMHGNEVNDLLKELSEDLHALNMKQEKLKQNLDAHNMKQWGKCSRTNDLPEIETEVKRPLSDAASNAPPRCRFHSDCSNQHHIPETRDKPVSRKRPVPFEDPHIIPTVKAIPSRVSQPGGRKLIQTLKDFKTQLQEEDITWS